MQIDQQGAKQNVLAQVGTCQELNHKAGLADSGPTCTEKLDRQSTKHHSFLRIQEPLTCVSRVEASAIAHPNVNKGVYQRLAVCVDNLDAESQRNANLVFSDVAAKQDIIQVVGTFLELGGQRAGSLHPRGGSLYSGRRQSKTRPM